MVSFLYIINTLDTAYLVYIYRLYNVYEVYMHIYKPEETIWQPSTKHKVAMGFQGFINMHIN